MFALSASTTCPGHDNLKNVVDLQELKEYGLTTKLAMARRRHALTERPKSHKTQGA